MSKICIYRWQAAKKSTIPKWNNLATIFSGTDDASPAKKKRKN